MGLRRWHTCGGGRSEVRKVLARASYTTDNYMWISPKPDLVLFCASLQWTVEKMVSNIILVAVPPFIRVEPVMPSGYVCVCVCESVCV